jgi:hypothetical protein
MSNRLTARGGGRLLLAAALALVVCLGCAPQATMPKTFSVKGKVVYKDGTPMDGGFIEFHSTTDPNLIANGDIQPDGTFKLSTPTGNARAAGAPEGQYTVTVIPKIADQTRQSDTGPIEVRTPYTVKPDEGNDFTVTLDRRKGRT